MNDYKLNGVVSVTPAKSKKKDRGMFIEQHMPSNIREIRSQSPVESPQVNNNLILYQYIIVIMIKLYCALSKISKQRC